MYMLSEDSIAVINDRENYEIINFYKNRSPRLFAYVREAISFLEDLQQAHNNMRERRAQISANYYAEMTTLFEQYETKLMEMITARAEFSHRIQVNAPELALEIEQIEDLEIYQDLTEMDGRISSKVSGILEDSLISGSTSSLKVLNQLEYLGETLENYEGYANRTYERIFEDSHEIPSDEPEILVEKETDDWVPPITRHRRATRTPIPEPQTLTLEGNGEQISYGGYVAGAQYEQNIPQPPVFQNAMPVEPVREQIPYSPEQVYQQPVRNDAYWQPMPEPKHGSKLHRVTPSQELIENGGIRGKREDIERQKREGRRKNRRRWIAGFLAGFAAGSALGYAIGSTSDAEIDAYLETANGNRRPGYTDQIPDDTKTNTEYEDLLTGAETVVATPVPTIEVQIPMVTNSPIETPTQTPVPIQEPVYVDPMQARVEKMPVELVSLMADAIREGNGNIPGTVYTAFKIDEDKSDAEVVLEYLNRVAALEDSNLYGDFSVCSSVAYHAPAVADIMIRYYYYLNKGIPMNESNIYRPDGNGEIRAATVQKINGNKKPTPLYNARKSNISSPISKLTLAWATLDNVYGHDGNDNDLIGAFEIDNNDVVIEYLGYFGDAVPVFLDMIIKEAELEHEDMSR